MPRNTFDIQQNGSGISVRIVSMPESLPMTLQTPKCGKFSDVVQAIYCKHCQMWLNGPTQQEPQCDFDCSCGGHPGQKCCTELQVGGPRDRKETSQGCSQSTGTPGRSCFEMSRCESFDGPLCNQAAKQEKQESIESQELNLEVAVSQLVRCNEFSSIVEFHGEISSLSMPELRIPWDQILNNEILFASGSNFLMFCLSGRQEAAAKALAAEAEKKTNAETFLEIQRDQRRFFFLRDSTSQESTPKHSCMDSD